MEVDVFVSHHTDSSLHIVEAIVNKLEANGIKCWYAPRNTEGSYAGSIAKAINCCSVFLLILNKLSSESVHVLNELDLITKRLAKKEEVSVIPFHTADDDIAEDAQYYLGRLHWIDAMTPPMYLRVDELVEKIATILGKQPSCNRNGQLATEQKYTLNAKIPQARDVFVGREDLMQEIETFFEAGNRVLFLEGIGGIGKSELAKQYALANRKKYDTILFVTYSDSLKALVCDPNMIEISGVVMRPAETPEEFYNRKLQILRSIVNERTLLIVDNFDVDSDPDMTDFLEGSHNVIFTTRNQHSGYHSIKVNAIPDKTVLFDIFEKNYGMPVSEEDKPYLEELFSLIEYHTYTIELLAKQMEASFSDGKELLESFKNGQLARSASESIVGRKSTKTAFGHIQSLFSISRLSEQELQVLRELSLMGIAGVPAAKFFKWSALPTPDAAKQVVMGLIRKSWVRRETGESGQRLSLHPLVGEVIRETEDQKPDAVNCRVLLERLADDMYRAWHVPFKENLAIADCVLAVGEYFSPFHFAAEDKDLLEIWTMIPNFLWQVGRFDDSIRLETIVYNTCLATCGEASMLTGFVAKALGGCYFNSGREQESIRWYKQGLQSMQLSGAEENEDLAMSYEKVARCYTWEYERDFDKAEALFQQSHEIRTRLKEALQDGKTMEMFEHRLVYDAAMAQERIGENYFEMGRMYQLKGDYVTALEYAGRQEEIQLKKSEIDVSNLAYAYYDKGVCYYHMGMLERKKGNEEQAVSHFNTAMEYLQKALTSNMKMRGALAIDTIDNEEYVGDTYAALGRYGDASNSYMSVVSMLEQLLGPDHPRITVVKEKMVFAV